MPPRSHNLVPCELFVYSCDNYFGAATERQMRNYDRERWSHREVEKKFDKRRMMMGRRSSGKLRSLCTPCPRSTIPSAPFDNSLDTDLRAIFP
jgi:hypothetical protein